MHSLGVIVLGNVMHQAMALRLKGWSTRRIRTFLKRDGVCKPVIDKVMDALRRL